MKGLNKMEQVYPRIVEFLEEELGKDTSGHSLDHAIRVYKNAKAILKSEGGNERVVLISALVHDVIDSKLFKDSREQQAKLLIFLQTLGCSQVELKEIFYIIENIPATAYEYIVNGKSAIEWIMERYAVITHKDSGITNNPNDWATEHDNPRYILDLLLSVILLSIEMMEIVNGLPKLTF